MAPGIWAEMYDVDNRSRVLEYNTEWGRGQECTLSKTIRQEAFKKPVSQIMDPSGSTTWD